MKKSLVITINNGENHLEEQLNSIENQSLKIDEFIFIDDGSSDSSRTIIENFIVGKDANVISNTKKLGLTKSFEKGIKLASGDIVFLAGQGDIWKERKVEQFTAQFQETSALFCFSDAELLDSEGNELPNSFLSNLNLDVKKKMMILEGKADLLQARRNYISGGMCAFRKEIKHSPIFPFIDDCEDFKYDHQIASIVAAENPENVHFIDDTLSYHRLANDDNTFNEALESDGNKGDYFQQKLNLIEKVLERQENTHFRRAHYFWYMRSLLVSKPFLQKFISINTLYLEGDYKRFTDKPIKEALADLKL